MKSNLRVTSYILRIYRKKRGQPRLLVGIVEQVGTKGRRAFTTFDELWEMLHRSRPGRQHPPKGSGVH